MAAKRIKTDEREFSAEMQKKLADRIKALRMAQGFANYEHFANAHDLPRAQYGRYEKGQNLNFSTLTRLVWIFDMSLAEFFSEGF
jgi:hypothetical protein